MAAAILQVPSLLIAIMMLMAGSGFLSTLISVRLEEAGTSALLIGIAATAYFAGLTVGAMRASLLIGRVGHIRAFAAVVSLFSASTLSYSVLQDPIFWTGLRFVDGLCVAVVFVCLESWLNEQADAKARGSILAAYMVALYLGQAAGQMLLNIGSMAPVMPFLVASLFISLAVLPVALTRMAGPPLQESAPFLVRRLYLVSPLGFVGAIVTGILLGAFYSLGPVYVRRLGMSISDVSFFMMIVILGGVALQWPLGRLSDRFDRRRIIVLTFACTLATALGIALLSDWTALLVLGALFGGFSFALYPLCVAHTNDHLSAHERVGASGGLVLLYSVGAATGPLLGAAAMSAIGPSGLFLFIAACATGALFFGFWRQIARLPVPGRLQGPYQLVPRTTPMAAVLDPLSTSEENWDAHNTEDRPAEELPSR